LRRSDDDDDDDDEHGEVGGERKAGEERWQ